MHRDDLYAEYIDNNSEAEIVFEGVQIVGTSAILLFGGKDLAGNELSIELDIKESKLGNTVLCCMQSIKFRELRLNDNVWADILIRPVNKSKYEELYDWV